VSLSSVYAEPNVCQRRVLIVKRSSLAEASSGDDGASGAGGPIHRLMALHNVNI